MRVHFGTSQLRHCVSIRQRYLPYLLRHERTSKARIPYSTGEVLNHVAVSEDSGRPNSSARESALGDNLITGSQGPGSVLGTISTACYQGAPSQPEDHSVNEDPTSSTKGTLVRRVSGSLKVRV
jgi:hypothetical protein